MVDSKSDGFLVALLVFHTVSYTSSSIDIKQTTASLVGDVGLYYNLLNSFFRALGLVFFFGESSALWIGLLGVNFVSSSSIVSFSSSYSSIAARGLLKAWISSSYLISSKESTISTSSMISFKGFLFLTFGF